jgi:hypothetical protein
MSRAVRSVLSRVTRVGDVHPVIMVVVVPCAVSAIVLGCVTANVYSKIALDKAQVDALGGVHTKHMSNSLYVASALEGLLAFLLVVRGSWNMPTFRTTLTQVLLIVHALLPSGVITALWAARVAVESLVPESVSVSYLQAGNPYVKASWSLLTATMVFSQLFTACTLAILTANSSHFLAAKEDLADALVEEAR